MRTREQPDAARELDAVAVGAAVLLVAGFVAVATVAIEAGETTGALSLLVAAQSGWGKSFKGQHVIEKNLDRYEHVLVLDFCDEFRGLVKEGPAAWWIGGPREQAWSADVWHDFVAANQQVVLARHDRLTKDAWQEICTAAIQGARRLGDVLIVIDEAHFVAPQTGKTPAAIEGLATTGRGEGASAVWITQRPAKVEETVISQCQARLLGGFESDADLDKVGGVIEYPQALHNPQKRDVLDVPRALQPDDRTTPVSVQKHEADGQTVGSEWVYSDNSGDRRRESTRGLADEMATTHYGNEGKDIAV